jgi:ADP-heptose:LPS heptosyltransferase
MEKILLFRFGGLGDLLVTLPAIHLLRKCAPSSWISLICHREYGKLLEQAGVVNECLSQEARQIAPLLSGSLDSTEGGDLRLQDFDRVGGWFKERSSVSGLESILTSEGMSSGFFVYDEHTQEIISRYFFRKTQEWVERRSSDELGFEECARLPLNSHQKNEGRRLTGEKPLGLSEKIIVIHPGSGSQEKCWPLPNFLEVVRRLQDENLRGVLVTGPAEERLEQEIEPPDLPENWAWVRKPSLLRLAGLLSLSYFYLGNDSGITHLAAACGTKGLALFRRDLEPAWRPYGPITVLSGSSVQDISFDVVWTKIEDQVYPGRS